MSDPRITDEMVDVAAEKLRDLLGHPISRDDVEEALEAGMPYLAPAPAVDREALFNVMDAALPVHVHADDRDRAIDAVLALLNGSGK